MKTLLTRASALLFLSALPATASTYVVADHPGAGIDFTTFAQAISTAVDGDVLIVRAGTYDAVHLDEALTILCDADVFSPVLDVHDLPAGKVAVVSQLGTLDIDVVNCQGTVIFDKVSADNSYYLVAQPARPTLNIASSADVRVYRSSFIADNYYSGSLYVPGDDAVDIAGSRVEFVRCTVRGGSRGATSCYSYAQYSSGGTGLDITGASTVHVALTSIWGGRGSGATGWDCDGWAGNGGPAISARNGSSVIVAGVPGDVIKGGRPGNITGALYGYPGIKGPPIKLDATSTARYSGVTLGGSALQGPANAFTHAIPQDPTLERLGNGNTGTDVTLVVHGASGWGASLDRGRQPILAPSAGPIPTLVQALASFPLGMIPANGAASKTVTISTQDPVGTLYVWQGVSASPSLEERRTNSVPVIVH